MRWLAKRRDDWSVGFAILPVTIGDDVVWLERYLYKFCGEYTAVELFSKERPRSMTEREMALFDAAWDLVTAIRRGGRCRTRRLSMSPQRCSPFCWICLPPATPLSSPPPPPTTRPKPMATTPHSARIGHLMALNTHGLTPTRQWKLWEIDGFQLLVTLSEDEDNEAHDCVRFATNVDEMGEVTVGLKGPPAAMQKAFDMAATDEASARQNLQGLLDQVVKAFPSLATQGAL